MAAKWFGRGGGTEVSGSDGYDVAELRAQHLLLVPSTVPIEEVAELVRARIPYADLLRKGEVPLGRHSKLIGPIELSMEDAVDAVVPMPWTVVYALQAPFEREDPPPPGVDDRDGFAFAFPDGLPWREEARGLHLIVALARRLQGAVRVVGGPLITPDAERAVDFIVHSPYWLEPEVLRGVVARELPSAQLAVQGRPYRGPSPDVYTGAILLSDIPEPTLTPEQLAALHESADRTDLSVLAGSDVLDAFAVTGEIPGRWAGEVHVLVHVSQPGDPAVAGQDWAERPFVTYEVRWACPDPLARESRVPTPEFEACRAAAAPVVAAVARVVVEAASGVVTDEDGFWVDRYFL